LESTTVNIPNGISRVNLNFAIPAQNNLKLMGPETPNLWRDGGTTTPNLPYPFEVGDFISITGNSANNVKYYYYFYDWEVEKSIGCESAKVPVTASIFNNPDALFSWVENSFTVTFTNASTGGGSYLWDFGDGNTSTDENPVHTYATAGPYTVTLTLTNDCGNDVYTQNIAVSTVSVYNRDFQMEVFPNPANDAIMIRTDYAMQLVELFTMQGIKVHSSEVNDMQEIINISHLPQGTYILRVTTEKGNSQGFVIKL
jgi:PKD repeat protein